MEHLQSFRHGSVGSVRLVVVAAEGACVAFRGIFCNPSTLDLRPLAYASSRNLLFDTYKEREKKCINGERSSDIHM
jgi:hypothetical protein